MPCCPLADDLSLENGRTTPGRLAVPRSPQLCGTIPQDLASSNPDHNPRIAPKIGDTTLPPSRLVWSDLTRCAMHRVLSIVCYGTIFPTTSP